MANLYIPFTNVSTKVETFPLNLCSHGEQYEKRQNHKETTITPPCNHTAKYIMTIHNLYQD